MKNVVFVFVCTLAVTANGINSESDGTVDWAEVSSRIDQVETTTTTAIKSFFVFAKEDNARVAGEIDKQLQAADVRAKNVLKVVKTAVRQQNLTEGLAKQYFAEHKKVFERIENDLQAELAQLSLGTQSLFHSTVDYADTQRLVNEIYLLLSGKTIPAVDWAGVETRFKQVETKTADAVREVSAIVKEDNAGVGGEVEKKLQAAGVRAKVILEQAKAAIRQQTLTEAQARQHFANLKEILEGVQADLQEELAQLSEAARNQIRGILNDTYAETERLANEIYNLLKQ